MSYLAIICKDIKRHLAHFLPLKSFFVRSVALPAAFHIKAIHYTTSKGFIIVTYNDNIYFFDAAGTQTRAVCCVLPTGMKHHVIDDEVILCPTNYNYCGALGWISREQDGFYLKGKKIASDMICFNTSGEMIRFEEKNMVFPNGVKIFCPVDHMVTLSAIFLIGVGKTFDLYTKTGLHVYHCENFNRLPSLVSCDEAELAILMPHNTFNIYDFSIFVDDIHNNVNWLPGLCI